MVCDQPPRILNDAALIADLCAPQPKVSSNGRKLLEKKVSSNGRKLLEKKEHMKRRDIRSPDGGDALSLTVAGTVAPRAGPSALGSTAGPQAATSAGY